MKILYCLAGTFNSGGMERIVTAKANWLAENGYQVFIVTTEQNGRSNFYRLNDNVERIDLDILYSQTLDYGPLKKIKEREHKLRIHFTKLQQITLEITPDIIISTFGNEVGLVPKLKTNAKIIAEIHFSRWYRLQHDRRGIWKLIDVYLTWYDKRIISKYDKFVCLTEEDRKNWKEEKNIIVIPNFIESVSHKPAKLNNRLMLAVGRLSYQKGYDRLIMAWKTVSKKYPDWKLEIYGSGEEYDSTISLIKSLELDKCIRICSPTPAINEVYQNASALILSSRYEGLPMVLLEAMSNGLPTVAYGCQCGPKDVITHGVDGLLVEEGDIIGLANAILQLIEKEGLRQILGKKAYDKAKLYTKEKVMPSWMNLFQSLTKEKKNEK